MTGGVVFWGSRTPKQTAQRRQPSRPGSLGGSEKVLAAGNFLALGVEREGLAEVWLTTSTTRNSECTTAAAMVNVTSFWRILFQISQNHPISRPSTPWITQLSDEFGVGLAAGIALLFKTFGICLNRHHFIPGCKPVRSSINFINWSPTNEFNLPPPAPLHLISPGPP